MAPLITTLNTHASQSTPSLVPSPDLRMPHVFVTPPEEEQQDNPPWCCFDADEQLETDGLLSNPDAHLCDVPYPLQPSGHGDPAPIPHRVPVCRPKPRIILSRKLEKKQRPEAIKIIENKQSLANQRGPQDDSDVIEVVKVKRGREALTDLEENTNVKRTKTLKARASQALQSIKNVGKGSHRTHVKEVWMSSETTPGVSKSVQGQFRSQRDQTENHPPPVLSKMASLSKSDSRSLFQIFQPVKSSLSESTFTFRVESSLADAHRALPTSKSSSLSRHDNTNSSFVDVSGADFPNDTLNRSLFPSASLKKTVNTKFSVRELHRIFSFSSSSPDDPSSTPSASMPSTSAISSSDHPDVPMDEDEDVDAQFVDLGRADRTLASQCPRLSDLSFEMKLGSLHFDALSFDPEDFDVPMEENFLR